MILTPSDQDIFKRGLYECIVWLNEICDVFLHRYSQWYTDGKKSSYPWLFSVSWWRHQMKTFCALLAFCEGNSPSTGEFPSHSDVELSCFLWSAPGTNGWVNHRDDAGDLGHHRAHYDVTVMCVHESFCISVICYRWLLTKYIVRLYIYIELSFHEIELENSANTNAYFHHGVLVRISINNTVFCMSAWSK